MWGMKVAYNFTFSTFVAHRNTLVFFSVSLSSSCSAIGAQYLAQNYSEPFKYCLWFYWITSDDISAGYNSPSLCFVARRNTLGIFNAFLSFSYYTIGA